MALPSLHGVTPHWLERVCFVLVGTSHPGNVGAAARAMRVMGLHELVLVAPRNPQVASDPEAIARASGASDVLDRATVVDTLATALARCTLAVAVSAETREFGAVPQPPEEVVREAFAEANGDPHARIAFVFGGERNGLSIDDVQRCHRLCSIPGARDYASLNLAQAVQILAYCLRSHDRLHSTQTAIDAAPAVFASQQRIESLYEHLERALVRIGFLDPLHPKKLMPRLRRLFGRARLESDEVELLRGVCTQIERACVNPYAPVDLPASPPEAARAADSPRAESE